MMWKIGSLMTVAHRVEAAREAEGRVLALALDEADRAREGMGAQVEVAWVEAIAALAGLRLWATPPSLGQLLPIDPAPDGWRYAVGDAALDAGTWRDEAINAAAESRATVQLAPARHSLWLVEHVDPPSGDVYRWHVAAATAERAQELSLRYVDWDGYYGPPQVLREAGPDDRLGRLDLRVYEPSPR
jgi:hypothetical protein